MALLMEKHEEFAGVGQMNFSFLESSVGQFHSLDVDMIKYLVNNYQRI